MTKIKFCGITRSCDIETVNELKPEYVGFVFAPGSRRYVPPSKAADFKQFLNPDIQAVGVFTDEKPENIAWLLNRSIIDMAQLHGSEDENDIRRLRQLAGKPVIKAFRVKSAHDVTAAEECSADYILLDSGAGTGTVFDWNWIRDLKKPYFLAGGLNPCNVAGAVKMLRPYAVDVSSGIETGGVKDKRKMAAFAAAVRKDEK